MATSASYVDRETIRELSERSDLMGTWLTLHVWGTVILSGALFIVWPNIFTFILAVMLIGSRQHGATTLMHEAAHGNLFKTRWLNEFVGHYLLALPFGADMISYRNYHLQHHKHAQRDNDPDLGLSAKFPVTQASLMRKLLRDITGWTAIRLRIAQFKMYKQNKTQQVNGADVFSTPSPWPFIAVNLLIIDLTLRTLFISF